MKLYTSIVAALAALSSASVLAQSTGTFPLRADVTFTRLDANSDGFLTRKEAAADKDVLRIFRKSDLDRDGKLTEDELIKGRSADDRERAEQYAIDSAITAKVKSELLLEKGIPSTAISVETYKGVVLLSGFVDDAGQIKRSVALVRKIGGVKSVKNSLSVK